LLTHVRAMNQTIIQIEGHYSELYASQVLREAVRGKGVPQIMAWLMTKSFDEMMLCGGSAQKSLYFVKTRNNHLIFREVIEGIRATNSETLVQI
jgi:hypothetical protein